MRIDVVMLCCVPVLSVIGALLSKRIKTTQNNFYLYLIPVISIFTGLTWAVISKYTKWPLSVATIIFDLTMSISYFFAFVALGESINLIQSVGVAFAIIALVLLNL